jgi:hypothetical protein
LLAVGIDSALLASGGKHMLKQLKKNHH